MGTKNGRDLPARLAGVRGRFERWRRTRKVGTRIPKSLWAAAVKVAEVHGINRTTKALRVNYYALKKRVEQKAAETKSDNADGAAATFLELAPLELNQSNIIGDLRAGLCECTLELEDAAGAKMRVYLKGSGVPDLAAISREFWRSEP